MMLNTEQLEDKMKGRKEYTFTFLEIFVSTLPGFSLNFIGLGYDPSNEPGDYRGLFYFGWNPNAMSIGVLFFRPKLFILKN